MNWGDVRLMLTNGQKSSTSDESNFSPYISFKAGSARTSVIS